MREVEIGIRNIDTLYLQSYSDELRIDDERNDGVIECRFENLKKTIRILQDVYNKRESFNQYVCGGRNTLHLGEYQRQNNLQVFRANYIIIDHIPAMIEMLESVKIKKVKYILEKDSLIGLNLNDLLSLKNTMRRRKKILIDNSGSKYIEV